jgi:protease I
MQKKAVIIVARGFDEREFYYPYFRLQEAGCVVDVSTMEGDEVKGKYGMPANPRFGSSSLMSPTMIWLLYLVATSLRTE